MGRHDDIIFVKQQGAMRTGTNLVKFALEENFTNVRVLVNIGRWKHATAETPFNWRGINWEGDGVSVDVPSRISRDELSAVRAAFDAGAINFAISIRDVYSWLVSYVRFTRPEEAAPLPPLTNLPGEYIVEALRQWNALYRSYLPLLGSTHGAMLFRLEDLLTNFDETLDRARLLWGLKPRHARYVRPGRYLRAGIDGETRSELLESSPFDPRSYLSDNRLAQFDDRLIALIRRAIDGDALRAYGYEVL
ncbi:MAG TPA: hypothetical protein VNI02_03455 [Blastocatellia bacterium]|jgi:hypothetical protein|nr:hypothetical protein [Blastocatellia bacterium]